MLTTRDRQTQIAEAKRKRRQEQIERLQVASRNLAEACAAWARQALEDWVPKFRRFYESCLSSVRHFARVYQHGREMEQYGLWREVRFRRRFPHNFRSRQWWLKRIAENDLVDMRYSNCKMSWNQEADYELLR